LRKNKELRRGTERNPFSASLGARSSSTIVSSLLTRIKKKTEMQRKCGNRRNRGKKGGGGIGRERAEKTGPPVASGGMFGGKLSARVKVGEKA